MYDTRRTVTWERNALALNGFHERVQGRRQDFEGGFPKKYFIQLLKPECQHYNGCKKLVLCNFYSNSSILRGCCPAKMCFKVKFHITLHMH